MSRPSVASDATGHGSPVRSTLPGRAVHGAAQRLDAAVFAGLCAVGLGLWLDPPVFAALALIGAAICLAATAPVAAIAAIVAAVPLAYQPVAIGGRAVSLLELAIVVGVLGTAPAVASAALTAHGRARLRRAAGPPATSVAAAALALAGAVSLAFVAEPERIGASLREVRWTVVEPLALFLLCRWALRDDADRRLPILALVGTATLVGGFAVGQALTGSGGLATGDVVRARLAFPHPNNLAFFLERAAVFAVGLAVLGHRRPVGMAAAAIAVAGVVTTFSRGGLLAVGCGVAVILAVRRDRRAWVGFAGAIVVVGLVLAATAGGRLADTGGTGGEATRLPIWRSSVRMALDHPLTGVGPDQFLYQYWRRYVEPGAWPERQTSHPHNLVLDVWLRLGILGLAAFAALAAAVGLAARRSAALRPRERAVAVSAVAALVAGAVHGMVDNGYFLPDVAALTWFLMALVEWAPAGEPPDSRT